MSSVTETEEERRPGETLRASSVSRSFAGVEALRDVTLELGRGEVVGLIGPNGATLAGIMEKFKGVPTLSGKVSFSPTLHSVYGRQYRVIKIQDNKPKLVGTVVAKVVVKI